MLDKVSALGLEAMEIGTGGYPNNKHCALDDLIADKSRARAWQRKFEDKGIQVATLSCHGNPLHLVSGGVGIGEIVMFGCPLSWAANTLIARRMLPTMSAISSTTWSALTGTVMLALVAAATGAMLPEGVSWRAWTAIFFIAIFGTAIGLALFYDGVRRIGAARTSVFINLVPVFAVSLGVIVLREPLEASMLVGGALVIGGIFLLNRTGAPRGAATDAA